MEEAGHVVLTLAWQANEMTEYTVLVQQLNGLKCNWFHDVDNYRRRIDHYSNLDMCRQRHLGLLSVVLLVVKCYRYQCHHKTLRCRNILHVNVR